MIAAPAPLDPNERLPKAYDGCTCSCHRVPGIKHVMACCGTVPRSVFVKVEHTADGQETESPYPAAEQMDRLARHRKAAQDFLGAAIANAGPRDWPEDFKHDNGQYLNTCCGCNQIFTGYKRRIECKLCAKTE
jgi:hypothetical protein